jgi:hypothetical protein
MLQPGVVAIAEETSPVDRKALLIGCPGKRGADNYLEGVERDLTNYDRFLRSPLGGAWFSSEIVALDDPPASTARAAIQTLKPADYSFVLFSGHGYVTSDGRSTMVCLRGDDEMNSNELRVGSAKHTLILDCCRVIERPSRKLAEDTLAKMDAAAARKLTRDECRKYFNRAVSECPSGLVVLHSCAVDETAGDDSGRGGYYSYSLIEVAEDWLESNSTDLSKQYAALRMPRAHEQAKVVVQRLSGNRQNPQIEKPRSEPYFPFAIVA